MKRRRFVLVLEERELGVLRALVDIALDSATFEGEPAREENARRAIAKIDAAEPVREKDLEALLHAAGDLLDTGEWEDFTKGRRRQLGNPYRGRKALEIALRPAEPSKTTA